MKILIACEESGRVREAFRAKGHEVWSCDTEPSRDRSLFHIQGDVLDILDDGWDMMIGFPPCRYLCNSGVQYLHTEPGRWEKMIKARDFYNLLWAANIQRVCLENSIPHRYGIGKNYTQTIQPYDFGEDASKRTCLKLRGLPKLRNTKYFPPRIVNGKKRWGNQTDSGQNKLGPSPDRAKIRATTYQGIADAMADQWGSPRKQAEFVFFLS